MAYLVNRYPEASLTTLRREIDAVRSGGIQVLRFAHRPSMQPLAGERDRAEAELTEYLATGNPYTLVKSFLALLIFRPTRVFKAIALVLRLKPLKMRNFSYLLLASRLLVRMNAGGAEHLHVHFAQSSAIVAMLAHVLGGPRWTMTVHGPEDVEPEHWRMLSILATNATATIAISRWAAEIVRKTVAPGAVDVHVIGMGVDREFLDAPLEIKSSGEILCVARLDQRKGHMVLLEAMEKLQALGLTPDLRLIGDGPCRTQLEYEARRRGLQGQVSFAGWISERQVKESLDGCRFCVLPSHSEGLPVSIMEAFARARPVIATEVAGVPELVCAMKNGILVPPGNADALAMAIRTLLDIPASTLFELGMRGRGEVLERFQSERNGRSLVKVWRESEPEGRRSSVSL